MNINETKFWSMTAVTANPERCWIWQHGLDRKGKFGYGRVSIGGKKYLAHRIAFVIANNAWPSGKVLHKCDTPRCCNPNHLYDGTMKQNMRDMMVRGRQPTVKLTEQQVIEIRRLRAAGAIYKILAEQFGVSSTCIWHAVNDRWQHINSEQDALK